MLDSPWSALIMIMGFFLMVETMHMREHEHCRSCPTCETTENY